jgi:hypothetical protein
MGSLKNIALVEELVDSGDSKSPASRRVGSSPTQGTTFGYLQQLNLIETQTNV